VGSETEVAGSTNRVGVPLIAIATIIAGISGYLVIWAVPRQAGFEAYAIFAVFWAVLYFIVGCLFGFQQEVTRAISARSPSSDPSHRVSTVRFALGTAGVVGLVVAATSPLWAPSAFGAGNLALLVPLVAGALAYVGVAAGSGVISGLGLWPDLALIVSLDGVLRLAAVLAVLGLDGDVVQLAWAVIAPFPVALGVVLFRARARIRPARYVEGTYRSLYWNSSRTMLAAAAMSLLVAGFPALLAFAARGVEPAYFGALVLVITILRAPLLVPLTAFQGFLVVYFTARQSRVIPTVLFLLGGVALGTAILAVAMALWGTPLFVWLFGPGVLPVADLLAPLVLVSGLIAGLYVTGPAILTRGGHAAYTTGWVVAAVLATAGLVLPIPLGERVLVALAVGPGTGLLVHLIWIVRSTRVTASAIP